MPTCISSAFDDWSRCSFPHDGIPEPVIQEAVTGRQPGVTVVDLAAGTVEVQSSATEQAIRQAISEEGYQVS